jgi:hypothetical protein
VIWRLLRGPRLPGQLVWATLGQEKNLPAAPAAQIPVVGRLDKEKCARSTKGPFQGHAERARSNFLPGRFQGRTSRQVCVKTLQHNVGKRRMCYHFCYQFRQLFRISTSSKSTWRRGESNPCFPRLRPLRSRKRFIREDSERIRGHGNAWMALDVTSIIGWPACGGIRNRSIGRLVSGMKMAGSAGSCTSCRS